MRVLNLRKGELHPLDDKTLEELTVITEAPGNFSMRLLAAEVWRLRAENERLLGLAVRFDRVIEQIAKVLGHTVEHRESFGLEQLQKIIRSVYDAAKKATEP